MLPGDPVGLGPGPHDACAIPALAPADVDRLILDHIGEDLVWSRTELEPIALVGAPGMKQLGPTWRDALPADVVLFLDHRSHPPAVVAWSGNPMRGLVRVADSLDELT
ncbi:MAG TPA: hypothetical protein VL463_01765 [Kofleriaceae bacterium]|nr:hypothetical protein [Kofleriaceae bacterium]